MGERVFFCAAGHRITIEGDPRPVPALLRFTVCMVPRSHGLIGPPCGKPYTHELVPLDG